MSTFPRTTFVLSALLSALVVTGCDPVTQEELEELELGTSVEELRCNTSKLGDSLAGLNRSQRQEFASGKRVFETEATVADGLGPVFNERSCVACHDQGAPGGAGELTVTRFGRLTNGVFDSLSSLGGNLIQAQGIGRAGACNYVAERVPSVANVTAERLTTPTFGLGLVEAVPDATLRALAASQPSAVRGRTNEVRGDVAGETRVGRFGWKSQVATLQSFSSGAFLNEMGITSPTSPNEVCPSGDCALLSCNPAPGLNDDGSRVSAAAEFMRLLAAPAAPHLRGAARDGERLFERVGCASCHTPTLRTGASDIASLNDVKLHPYSDFLLHDMGELGDGIPQGDAKPSEMRTAPLWGAHARTLFLHDGRARNIDEATRAHAGQGAAARDAYVALPRHQRQQLLSFVSSL